MKIYKKIIVLALILIVLCTVAPQKTLAITVNDITALNATFESIQTAVLNNSAITRSERINLLSQIILLKEMVRTLQPTVASPEFSSQQTSSQTPHPTDIRYVIVRYDQETHRVVAEVVYHNENRRIFNFEYRDLRNVPNYNQKISQMKTRATQDIAIRLSTTTTAVGKRMFVSTRNPARDSVISILQNSTQANNLASEFGDRSVITEMKILPKLPVRQMAERGTQMVNVSEVVIEVLSDQLEKLVTTVTRTTPTLQDPTYKLATEFYFLDRGAHDQFRDPTDPRNLPIVSGVLNDLTEDEFMKEFSKLFAEVEIAANIGNYEQKLLSFLLDNTTAVSVGESSNVTDGDRNCYPNRDIEVASQSLYRVLEDAANQHILKPQDIKFLAPVTYVDFHARPSCINVRNIF